MRKLLSSLILLLVTLPLVADTTMFIRRAAPGGVSYIEDNFSGTLDAWVQTVGAWTITGGELAETSGTSQQIIYNTELSSDDGHGCWKHVTSNFSGFVFRATNNASKRNYVLRNNESANYVWRHCLGASCVDIELDTGAIGNNNYVGVIWSGTGTSTVVEWFRFLANGCPQNEKCTAGSTPWACCTGSGTGTCTKANWATEAEATATMLSDPPPTGCTGSGTPWGCCTGSGTGCAELSGGVGQRYVGLYDGGSGNAKFDDFRAWAD